MEKLRIKEAVVVEGRDDESAVLRACDCMVICTHGYGISAETIERIRSAEERCGIIIFTDPDYAGGNIRKKLTELFPGAKQAYLNKDEAEKNGDIGIENASPESIAKALSACIERCAEPENAGISNLPAELPDAVTKQDLIELELSGGPDSSRLRAEIGAYLGIGSCNASGFVKRLKGFGIGREELLKAWETSKQRKA